MTSWSWLMATEPIRPRPPPCWWPLCWRIWPTWSWGLASPNRASARCHPCEVWATCLIRAAFRLLIGPGTGDLLSGYRGFSRTFVQTVELRSEGFEIETELAIQATTRKLRTLEVSVPYRPRIAGTTSKLRAFRDGRRILATILRQSLRHQTWRPISIWLIACVLVATWVQPTSAAALARGVIRRIESPAGLAGRAQTIESHCGAPMMRANRRVSLILLCVFVLLCSRVAAGDATATEVLEAGVAAVDITPPVGMRMADNFNEHISKGIHDRLFAKAIVFAQDQEKAALVVCDLTAMSREVANQARALAAGKTGIAVDHISIGATHTHGGVLYYDVRDRLWHERAIKNSGKDVSQPIDYPRFLADRCAEAISRADAAKVPIQLVSGITRVTGLAFNRRYHMKDGSVVFNPGKRNPAIVRAAGPTDPDLHFVFLNDAKTLQPLGSLSVFAMHVATFGGDHFGADFPMHLQNGLRNQFGPDFISVFGEGCAGDVNHVDVTSDKPQPSTSEPQRIGDLLARSIVEAKPLAPTGPKPSLAVRSRVVRWPLQEITDEQVERARELFDRTGPNSPTFLITVEAHKILEVQEFRKLHGESLPMEVRVFRLDQETAIVTLPHEIFVELGSAIKKASPFRNTLVISLCNDVDFYIPTKKAFAEGSYEVVNSRVKPGAGEALVTAAIEMLNELSNRSFSGSALAPAPASGSAPGIWSSARTGGAEFPRLR